MIKSWVFERALFPRCVHFTDIVDDDSAFALVVNNDASTIGKAFTSKYPWLPFAIALL
jgi:hypothetical protein